MTEVKICGLKNKQDILYANQLKPDYVGFVFAKSSRQVTLSQAKELIKGLDQGIKKVGVFLNTPLYQVNQIAHECHLDVLQFHGDEDAQYCTSFDQPVWKCLRIKDANDLKELEDYPVPGILLDTFVKGQYGGTGKAFGWNMVKGIRESISQNQFVILAGGLTSRNVKKAIEIVHPKIVDVSSGVEINGQKSFRKMKEFIENVRKSNE